MRLLLVAHRAGLALAGVEQPRLLLDPAAVLENCDLPARFIFDRLADEADRIHVLDFAARAERLPRTPHRYVHVGAQAALFHVAVAGAKIAQDRAQLGEIGPRCLGRAQVRLGDDLHQPDAAAVEIDQRHGGMLLVQRLAGIRLEMQPLDPHGDGLAVRHVDDHFALAHQRGLVLADLIALRQIGIKIVLTVEYRLEIDPRFQPQAGADRLSDALLVDDGEHAGHRRIDERDLGIRRIAECGGSPGEQLGVRGDLRVHLHADDDFPIAGGACEKLVGFFRNVHSAPRPVLVDFVAGNNAATIASHSTSSGSDAAGRPAFRYQ